MGQQQTACGCVEGEARAEAWKLRNGIGEESVTKRRMVPSSGGTVKRDLIHGQRATKGLGRGLSADLRA